MAVQFHQQHGGRILGQAGLAEIFHGFNGKVIHEFKGGGNDPSGDDGGDGDLTLAGFGLGSDADVVPADSNLPLGTDLDWSTPPACEPAVGPSVVGDEGREPRDCVCSPLVAGVRTQLSKGGGQAAAAVGQIRLAPAYETALGPHGVTTAQILVTSEDSENRRRYLNSRRTFETLLELGVAPIVNENDTVATDEIRFGDNDRLAAQVASMAGADLLVVAEGNPLTGGLQALLLQLQVAGVLVVDPTEAAEALKTRLEGKSGE